MAIYYNKLNAKLDAINAKDLADIIAKNTYIPRLGFPPNYDQTSLQGWLDKKANFLDDGKVYTEVEINNFKNTIYNRLTKSSKAIADNILAGNPYEIPDSVSDNDYDDLMLIILYKWITTP